MSHGDGTVLRLCDVTRQLREHHAEHGGQVGCARCLLWRIYTRGSKHELDAFILGESLNGDEQALEQARAIRSGWGEGDWTAGDIA